MTAAVAVPAYAGIPVTHRRYTTLVTFITGHEDPTKEASTIPWEALGQEPRHPGLSHGGEKPGGKLPATGGRGPGPADPGGGDRKGRHPGPAHRDRDPGGHRRPRPGRPASSRRRSWWWAAWWNCGETLKWWETRPLWGKTVVVTRSREQATQLVELLAAAGARCLEVPTIEIGPPDDFGPLDAALKNLSQYQWVIFTSANGVAAFMDRLFQQGRDVRALGGPENRRHRPGHGRVPAGLRPQGRRGAARLQGRSAAGGPGSPGDSGDAGCSWPGPRSPGRCCRRAWCGWGPKWTWPRSIRPGRPGEIPPEAEAALKEGQGGYPHLHQLRHGA